MDKIIFFIFNHCCILKSGKFYLLCQLDEVQLRAVLAFENHVDGQDAMGAVKSGDLRIEADEGHRETDGHQTKEEGSSPGQILARFADGHCER